MTLKKPLVVGTNNKPEQLQTGDLIHPGIIQIPTPKIKIGHSASVIQPSVYLGYHRQRDETFRNYNASYWFFRYRSRRRKKQWDDALVNNETKNVKAGWVHPTDLNRLGKSQGNRVSNFLYWGETAPGYEVHTEFPLPALPTNLYGIYSPIAFDCLEWFSFKSARVLTSDFPLSSASQFRPSGTPGGKKKNSRTVSGYFRIVIDDPLDTTNTFKNKLFGPPSDIMTLKPIISSTLVTGISISLVTRGVKRNI